MPSGDKEAKFRLTPRITGAALAAPLVLPLLDVVWKLANPASAYQGAWGREKLVGGMIVEVAAVYLAALTGAGLVALAFHRFKWPVSSRMLIPVSIGAGGLLALFFIVLTGALSANLASLLVHPGAAILVGLGGAAAAIVSSGFCLMAGIPWRPTRVQ